MQLSGLQESNMRDIEEPIKDRINEIIDIVASTNDHTILLIDEVPTVNEQVDMVICKAISVLLKLNTTLRGVIETGLERSSHSG